MELSAVISERNFKAFLWHAIFAALAINFMDVDTVLPSMMINAGGGSFLVGLISAIMLGGSRMSQFFFTPFLQNRIHKKVFLLLGINSRILALLGLAFLFFKSDQINPNWVITFIFLLVILFSVGGAFAEIPYTDIIGKSILQKNRKRFFSLKQLLASIMVFLSALAVKQLIDHFDYPQNYFYLFLVATFFLLLASLGFYHIREHNTSNRQPDRIRNLREYLKRIIVEVRSNKRLTYYMLIVNTLGIGLAILPFIILYAKTKMEISAAIVGELLVFKTIGLVLTSLLVYRFSKRFKYQHLLYFAIGLLGLLVITSMFFIQHLWLFRSIFLGGGIFVSLFSIVKGGILLEITTDENRAFFTGITGASNIFLTMFPIISGILVEIAGFPYFFGLSLLIITGSVYFAYQLKCTR
jgi:MFS family permease